MARSSGTGAVAIRASSHFGAAGAYAKAVAEAGMLGFCFCNSDSFVRLQGGAEKFHGTNPIAMAGPAGEGQDPWLFDMATSAIPFNKVQLSRALGIPLPPDTASNGQGVNTTDPDEAAMLAPLGGEFGYKGAGLAVVSAALEPLCKAQALANAPNAEAEGATIIVSIGDKPSEFGVPDPDVVQVFEAYTVENGTCIWEVF